jgi:plastocyanin
MRTLFKLILLAGVIYGGWYMWKNYDIPAWYKTVRTAIENKNTKGALIWPQKRGEPQKDPASFYIKNCVFSPSSLSVNKGEAVRWYNEDNTDRQVVSDSFDSGLINPGKSYSRVFDEAGTYNFSCDGETNKGQITVK